jgi:amidohydrolase
VQTLDEILDSWLDGHETELIATRRDLHAHPEIAFAEHRTTDVVMGRLRALGLDPWQLPDGTGVVCDLAGDGPLIALRADLDALPLQDVKDVAYRSTNPGVCHACGHDAHTTIVLGTAEVLARLPRRPRVRFIFQPAEEVIPGGALRAVAAGVLDGVEQIYTLHCDPRVDTGQVGTRVGPITAACDIVQISLEGPGGHTARPHLTADLVYALGRLITDLPALVSRRTDARAGASLVWGNVAAGHAVNAIPSEGLLRGTLRILDHATWLTAEPLVRELIEAVVAPTGAKADVTYTKGVPPVVNDAQCVSVQDQAVLAALGPGGLTTTAQSMGGEDFAWYAEQIPGALARLGVRQPGAAGSLDLHRPNFDIDERALAIGVRFLTHTALLAHRAV